MLQRAILAHINKAFPQKCLEWKAAEVNARKALKPKAGGEGGRSSRRGDDSCEDDGEEVEVPTYGYLTSPPEGQYVKVGCWDVFVETARVVLGARCSAWSMRMWGSGTTHGMIRCGHHSSVPCKFVRPADLHPA